MADPVTNNLALIEMATGTASGQWGAVLNASMIAIVDAALGNTVSVPLSSSNVSLSTTQRQNLGFSLTGTLSGNVSVSLPLSPNSTSAAVGGEFIFENNTTGGFNVTVNTVVTGSLGVVVPQGARALLYSDTVNVKFGDDTQNQVAAYNGNPNTNVAGYSASAARRASKVIDRSTNEEYLCVTGTGSAAGAVWSKALPYSFPAQGYLTANNDPTNPVLTVDSLGASTIYYTAFRGNQVFVNNGVSFVPLAIPGGQLTLALSNSAQAANGIYDALGFLLPNGTTLVVAFSPAWAIPTAGAGARGTGAGTPQLSRVNGLLVNAVPQTANNGATSYQIGTALGTYLGSVFVDSSPGQVTCNASYGQSRKFGVWNAYNREPISIKEGDGTATWNLPNTTITAFRSANNNAANVIASFTGLAEEIVEADFTLALSNPSSGQAAIAMGANSTSVAFGTRGVYAIGQGGGTASVTGPRLVLPPGLGVNNLYALEAGNNAPAAYGTEPFMVMRAKYNG